MQLMKGVIKWVFVLGGGLAAVLIAGLIIVPLFVDVQKYKPDIEKLLSGAAERPITIGGDIRLSLFPWVGLALSELRVGNPAGFKERDFVTVATSDLRIKLLPLLSRDIQIKRFLLKEPRIVLIKNREGHWNFESPKIKPGEKPDKALRPEKVSGKDKPEGALPIKGLQVGEFAVTKGSFLLIDQVKGTRQEVSDVAFRLTDVSLDRLLHKDLSLDRPARIALSFLMDGKPFFLEGKFRPAGKGPGSKALGLDITLNISGHLQIKLTGMLHDAATHPRFDLILNVPPFSLRKLAAAFGRPLPVATADAMVWNRIALKAQLLGGPKRITLSKGALRLDDSKAIFSLKAMDLSRPDVTFSLDLDQIDLDRYLPPRQDKKRSKTKKRPKGEKRVKVPSEERKKHDYAALRRLVLHGTIRVGKLNAQSAKLRDLFLKVTGKNGLFHFDPLTLNLYQGKVAAKGVFDVRHHTPKSKVELRAKGIEVGPLIRDIQKKDLLDGTARAEMALQTAGDDAGEIKRRLNGRGTFLIKDGTIKGIDLAGMVRNIKAAFGLDEKGGNRVRTDFSELRAPFTIKSGVVETSGTTLHSPHLRVKATGKADLVKETLDIRVDPEFVADPKIKGAKLGLFRFKVPVLVTGTFSSPSFRPHIEGIVTQGIDEGIKRLFKGAKEQKDKDEKDESESLRKKARDLLKGLGIGD